MRIRCTLMDKRIFEVDFNNSQPTVGELKSILCSLLLDIPVKNQHSPAFSLEKKQHKAFLSANFGGQDIFTKPDNTLLFALNISDGDTIRIGIRAKQLGEKNLFFVNKTKIPNMAQETNSTETLSAKL